MDPYKSQIKKLIRHGSLKVIQKISIEEESIDETECLGGYIYNVLNESSFYQVGACLQDESFQEDWIPHISVGSEINKIGLVMRVGFLICQLDMITTSWVLYLIFESLIFS